MDPIIKKSEQYQPIFAEIFEEISDETLLRLLSIFDASLDARSVVLAMNIALREEKKYRDQNIF